jgi:cysteinyl-tRNA synthetase
MIQIHNTLSGKKEEFKPLKGKDVSMYVCGITPYDSVHLGHARAYITFDIIKRHLLKRGYSVKHVQNFTDIDDKIIARAAQKGISPKDLAKIYIEDYFAQTQKLNILKADTYPRVTEMVPQIITFIEKLINSGYAYVSGGDVYFSVKKFAPYGKLSKRNLDDLKAGARVSVDENKKDAYDFALWKAAKENESEIAWDSPWGKGRPGWHIECSVMSNSLLGESIDMHGGGQDLIFPHHENEIAQSEAVSSKQFVKYWVHNGFVTVNKEKMSKSLGNFFTLSDIFKKYDPMTVRYYLLTQGYRSPLDFSDESLNSAKNALAGLNEAYEKLAAKVKTENPVTDAKLADIENKFYDALDDDFNTEKALACLHTLKNLILTELHSASAEFLSEAKYLFRQLYEDALGLVLTSTEIGADIEALLSARNAARKEKNWAEADKYRNELDKAGYKIIDNPDGTSTAVKKS